MAIYRTLRFATIKQIASLLAFVVAIGTVLTTFSSAANADIFGSSDRQHLIQQAIAHHQIIIRRGKDRRFELSLCRCPFPVEYDSMPDHLRHALVATEDKRFYSSMRVNGNDLIAIAREIVLGGKGGASGINQQLLKNLLLGADRTYTRKAREFWEAGYVESGASKEAVITAYLNNMDFGHLSGRPVIGVEQASRAYFGKSIRNTNLYEAALLVGMLKAPNTYNPIRHPDAAHKRAIHVLNRMVDEGYIQASDKARALEKKSAPGKLSFIKLNTEFYISWVLRHFNENITTYESYDELRVIIGLDTRAQIEAHSVITRNVQMHRGRGAEQGALVAMGPDGLVHALIGGIDFQVSQFDRASVARRQPGSTFKPIVYLAALQSGLNPHDRILDAALRDGWPRNYSHKYEGLVEIRRALALSLNGATVQLGQRVGYEKILTTARQLGITSNLQDVPSLALGSHDTTLMQMVGAYATIANGGNRVVPHGILAVTTLSGDVVFLQRPRNPEQVISAASAEKLTQMLRVAVVSGTGTKANFGPGAVGKTGTTQENRDALFIGYDRNDKFTTGVWFGNDRNSPMQEISGSSVPATAWNEFYIRLKPDRAPKTARPSKNKAGKLKA